MHNSKVNTVLFVGVGGQGIILASDIFSEVMLRAGFDIKKSEVHGMAQRGGCVSSHVRYGEKVFSPLANKGDVDILVSFERMETLRYIDYLNVESAVVINDEEVFPPSVNLGDEPYPADITGFVQRHFQRVKILKATDMARNAGDARMANTVMLGTLSAFSEVDESYWKEVLREMLPKHLVRNNIAAFDSGRRI
ncbi:MAG: hypothetical protein AVO39_05430 [delta proteobacterium MLS_D]|jgi:indolepyruvate ferredoxin oxidoreductase, beta subunit|nr:MAG: hypothetical protein AVO39_05430 [delta proteobacterium MLS_D]